MPHLLKRPTLIGFWYEEGRVEIRNHPGGQCRGGDSQPRSARAGEGTLSGIGDRRRRGGVGNLSPAGGADRLVVDRGDDAPSWRTGTGRSGGNFPASHESNLYVQE